MLKCYAGLFAFFATALPSLGQAFAHTKGQEFLYFRKNGHREAVYGIGDVVTFELKGTGAKVSDRIKGFQDSLVVFEAHVLNHSKIGAIYVDAKTKQWFIFRYKYEKVFFLAGAFFLPIDVVNTGKVEPRALAISGALLGVGLLAKGLISKKLKIKGNRKQLVIAY